MAERAFHHTNQPKNFLMTGPEALRSFFFPRQTVQIQEAARILGIGREAFYKRIWKGNNDLKISKTASSRQFILLDDLISYLYPSVTSLTSPVSQAKRTPGRPRKSTEGGVR